MTRYTHPGTHWRRGDCRGGLTALALLACLALLGCGADTPELAPLPDNATILAFGDSLTFGTGASPVQSYPAVLERLTGRKTVNAGIPGELSAAGLARLPRVLDETRPQLLILCHGGNDILRKRNLERTKQNLREMIELAQARGIAVVLVAVPEPSLILNPAGFYAEVASEYKVPLQNDSIAAIMSKPSLRSDTIHPNARGYEALAHAVYETLQASGAI